MTWLAGAGVGCCFILRLCAQWSAAACCKAALRLSKELGCSCGGNFPTQPSPSPHHCLPPRYNPIKTIKTSFIGTMNMLGLAKRCRARFLISSTSEVYGDPLQHPQVGICGCAWKTIAGQLRAMHVLFCTCRHFLHLSSALARPKSMR